MKNQENMEFSGNKIRIGTLLRCPGRTGEYRKEMMQNDEQLAKKISSL